MTEINPQAPKVFISYSWDTKPHRIWVLNLATRLRENGVDVVLDQWHVAPGDQLPAFMEKAVRENDNVLIICTPKYKLKSDTRTGGVGYEGDIMTGEVFTEGNNRKFIPLLREGEWRESSPSWLRGMSYIDLRGKRYSEENFKDLLATFHNQRPKAPALGRSPLRRSILKDDVEKLKAEKDKE